MNVLPFKNVFWVEQMRVNWASLLFDRHGLGIGKSRERERSHSLEYLAPLAPLTSPDVYDCHLSAMIER